MNEDHANAALIARAIYDAGIAIAQVLVVHNKPPSYDPMSIVDELKYRKARAFGEEVDAI